MKFLDIMKENLPKEISQDVLRQFAPDELWRTSPEKAAIHALRRCGKFDVIDYLKRYPEVNACGKDPIAYFIERGMAQQHFFICLPEVHMASLRVQEALQYFRQGQYEKALVLYKELAAEMGRSCFEANIAICNKRLGKIENLKRTKDISVIIPAYNAEKYIGRALQSILSQSLTNKEIIIFDDCSTDDTVHVIKKIQAEHPNILLLESDRNVGQGKGRNVALRHARGRFVTFLDADDYYLDSGYLEFLLTTALAKHADVVVTPYTREQAGAFRCDSLEPGLMRGAKAARQCLSRRFGTHGPCGKLFRWDIAVESAFVEFGYSQDVLFVFRAMLKAGRVCVSKRRGYVYVQDSVSSWRPSSLTDMHFFSSLRLVAEVWAECLTRAETGPGISPWDFVRSWRKDHRPRLASYLQEHGNEPWTRAITAAFDDVRAFLLQMLDMDSPAPEFYAGVTDVPPPAGTKVSREALEYARNRAAVMLRGLDRQSRRLPRQGNRALIVIYVAHLSSGGLERVAAQLGTALSTHYDILYLLDNPQSVDFSHPGEILKAELFDASVRAALENAAFIFDFKYKKRGREYPLCLYALDRFAHKYIATVHNTKTCGDYIEKIRDYLGERTCRALYATLCVSEAVKSELARRYGTDGRVEVLHNPVDLCDMDAVPPCRDMATPFILFAGRLNATRHKGVDILLRAWTALPNKGKVRLVLAGAGSLDADMQDILKAHGDAAQVDVLGFRKDIYALMKKALFVAAPSRWEGFSMTLIESLACGTPVLSTRVGGAGEVIRDGVNGLFVQVNNVQDTIRGMQHMLAHAKDMTDACRPSVTQFDMPSFRKKLLNLLEADRAEQTTEYCLSR